MHESLGDKRTWRWLFGLGALLFLLPLAVAVFLVYMGVMRLRGKPVKPWMPG